MSKISKVYLGVQDPYTKSSKNLIYRGTFPYSKTESNIDINSNITWDLFEIVDPDLILDSSKLDQIIKNTKNPFFTYSSKYSGFLDSRIRTFVGIKTDHDSKPNSKISGFGYMEKEELEQQFLETYTGVLVTYTQDVRNLISEYLESGIKDFETLPKSDILETLPKSAKGLLELEGYLFWPTLPYSSDVSKLSNLESNYNSKLNLSKLCPYLVKRLWEFLKERKGDLLCPPFISRMNEEKFVRMSRMDLELSCSIPRTYSKRSNYYGPDSGPLIIPGSSHPEILEAETVSFSIPQILGLPKSYQYW